MTLPRDFLTQIARECELSAKQESIFLLRMADNYSYSEIGKQLGTSGGACLKQMGEVYKKLKITGDSRGKENRLRVFLLKQLEKSKSKAELSPISNKPNELEQQVTESVPEPSKERSHLYQNLPARDYTAFIGRGEEIARLLELLSFQHAAHLISVDGIGGVGKTTLVLEAAYRCLGETRSGETLAGIPTFDAIIFTSAKQQYLTSAGLLQRLKTEQTLPLIFREIARTLDRRDITHAEPEAQLERTRECLARQRTLLIADNLETIEDKDDVLSFLYDLPPTVKVVITTREQALFVPIRLSSLPEDDGLRLIEHQAKEKGAILSQSESTELYHKTSGVPAAIVYAIGQIAAGYLIKDVLEQVGKATGDMARFCFSSSVTPLKGQPSHILLMALALFPKPALKEAIAFVASSTDPIMTSDGLARLQQLSLVNQQSGRYSMLALTREYALAELAIHPDFEQAAREQWIGWYRKFSETYRTDSQEWNQPRLHLEQEWENLQATLEWCIVQERYSDVCKFWSNIKEYTHVRGYWDARLSWTAWLIQAAEQRKDYLTAAAVMLDRSNTLTLIGGTKQLEEADAILARAWDLCHHKELTLKQRTFQFDLALEIIYLRIRQQKFEEALDLLEQEKELLEKTHLEEQKHNRLWIQLRYYTAEICYNTQNYPRAKTLYLEALSQAQKISWQRAIIYIKHWLADVEIGVGNLDEAQHLLEEGLSVSEHNKDKRCTACYHRSLARMETLRGNLAQSQHWARLAIEGFDRLGMIPEAEEMQTLLQS